MISNTPDSEKYIPDLYFTVNQMKATGEIIWVRNWCKNRVELLSTIKDYKHRKEATARTAKLFTHVMIIKAPRQFDEMIRHRKIPPSFIDWSQIKAPDVYKNPRYDKGKKNASTYTSNPVKVKK